MGNRETGKGFPGTKIAARLDPDRCSNCTIDAAEESLSRVPGPTSQRKDFRSRNDYRVAETAVYATSSPREDEGRGRQSSDRFNKRSRR